MLRLLRLAGTCKPHLTHRVMRLAIACKPDRAHVMQEGAVPRIVPRVVVELERPQEYLDMLTGLKADMIKVLTKECKRSRLDGLVRSLFLTLSEAEVWHLEMKTLCLLCLPNSTGKAAQWPDTVFAAIHLHAVARSNSHFLPVEHVERAKGT